MHKLFYQINFLKPKSSTVLLQTGVKEALAWFEPWTSVCERKNKQDSEFSFEIKRKPFTFSIFLEVWLKPVTHVRLFNWPFNWWLYVWKDKMRSRWSHVVKKEEQRCPLRAVDVDPGRPRSLVIVGYNLQVRRQINESVHPRYANWLVINSTAIGTCQISLGEKMYSGAHCFSKFTCKTAHLFSDVYH